MSTVTTLTELHDLRYASCGLGRRPMCAPTPRQASSGIHCPVTVCRHCVIRRPGVIGCLPSRRPPRIRGCTRRPHAPSPRPPRKQETRNAKQHLAEPQHRAHFFCTGTKRFVACKWPSTDHYRSSPAEPIGGARQEPAQRSDRGSRTGLAPLRQGRYSLTPLGCGGKG